MKTKEYLGKEVKDLVTGFSGIVTSVSFDLYGCNQLFVTPKVDEKGAIGSGHWFDEGRVVVESKGIKPKSVQVDEPGAANLAPK